MYDNGVGDVCSGSHGGRCSRFREREIGGGRRAHDGDRRRSVVREVGIGGAGSDIGHIHDLCAKGGSRIDLRDHRESAHAAGAARYIGIGARNGAGGQNVCRRVASPACGSSDGLESRIRGNGFAEDRIHGIERPRVADHLGVSDVAARRDRIRHAGIRDRQISTRAEGTGLCTGCLRDRQVGLNHAGLPHGRAVGVVRQCSYPGHSRIDARGPRQ